MNSLILKRSAPTVYAAYESYRPYLRIDFWFSCAYCSLGEAELSGIRFEVEHYLPEEFFDELKSTYSNLYYSCSKCNGFKGTYFPTDEQRRNGHYIIRVDEECPLDHFYVEGDKLIPVTPTGEFNIEWLYLNRQLLKLLRREREELYRLKLVVSQGLRFIYGTVGDRLPVKEKATFFALRTKIRNEARRIHNSIIDTIRSKLRSPACDPDPHNSPDAKQRREYLKRLRAQYPRGKYA